MNELVLIPDFKDLIPPLSPDEYSQLEENILSEGCRDAIVVWQGIVVDGHNRYEICSKHDLSYKTIEKEFDNDEQAKEWIILNQFGRRNLSDFQRSELALRLKPIIEAKAKKNQVAAGGDKKSETAKSLSQNSVEAIDTQKQLAQIAGVSHDTIHKVETIQQKAPEPIKEAVKSGEISINKAHNLTKQVKDLPEEEKVKKAEQLLTEQKQARKATKTGKSPQNQKPVSIEETATTDETSINEDAGLVEPENLSVENAAKDTQHLSAQPAEEKPADTGIEVKTEVNIQDNSNLLLKILEEITSVLGTLVGQAETAINQLSEIGEYKYILGNYIEAIHKYAERLDAAWRLKLKGEKRNAR